MNRKLTQSEFDKIDNLVMRAIQVYSKKDAEGYISLLDCSLSVDVAPNIKNIFDELICDVKSAAGRVQDKELRVSFVKQSLYKLHSFGVDDLLINTNINKEV